MDVRTRIARRPQARMVRVRELAVAMGAGAGVGLLVGLVTVALDHWLLKPPPIDIGDVASVQTLLGSIAGGIFTIAVFSLWMRTVVVGLMSGQFSPRTLTTFLEDDFQRHLLGTMVAGLVTVLVVLVGLPTQEGALAPLFGTTLSVAIGVSALGGVLAAIQHATRSLSVSELIARLSDEALLVLSRQPEAGGEPSRTPAAGGGEPVRAPGSGWVTAIDTDALLDALPAGGLARLHTRVGAFVTPHTVLAQVTQAEAEVGVELDREAIIDAFQLGRTRSPDLDLGFALGQLLDVGVHALRGATDTATAHEVLVHLGAVLEAVVERGAPLRHAADAHGRRIYDEAGWGPADYVQLCAERLRDSASDDPEAARHVLQMLSTVREVAEEVEDLTVLSEIGRQVEGLLALLDSKGVLPRDRQRLARVADALLATHPDESAEPDDVGVPDTNAP